jgi:hypothetical protein
MDVRKLFGISVRMVKPLYTHGRFCHARSREQLKALLAPNADLVSASHHGDIARVNQRLCGLCLLLALTSGPRSQMAIRR